MIQEINKNNKASISSIIDSTFSGNIFGPTSTKVSLVGIFINDDDQQQNNYLSYILKLFPLMIPIILLFSFYSFICTNDLLSNS